MNVVTRPIDPQPVKRPGSRTPPASPDLQPVDLSRGLPSGLTARAWARSLGAHAATRIVSDFSRQHAPAGGPIDVLDLFCGCGGMSTGFEFLSRLVPSYRLVGAVDIDRNSI